MVHWYGVLFNGLQVKDLQSLEISILRNGAQPIRSSVMLSVCYNTQYNFVIRFIVYRLFSSTSTSHLPWFLKVQSLLKHSWSIVLSPVFAATIATASPLMYVCHPRLPSILISFTSRDCTPLLDRYIFFFKKEL